MKIRRCFTGAAIGIALATVTGCTSLKPAADAAASPTAAAGVPQIWQYPASEFPTMCLVLEPGGNAHFVGGFLYFNPSSWRVDAASGLTLLSIGGGKLPMPPVSSSLAAASAATAATAAAVRVDEGSRTIGYRIDPQTASIDFGGFVFFRTARCTAH